MVSNLCGNANPSADVAHHRYTMNCTGVLTGELQGVTIAIGGLTHAIISCRHAAHRSFQLGLAQPSNRFARELKVTLRVLFIHGFPSIGQRAPYG